MDELARFLHSAIARTRSNPAQAAAVTLAGLLLAGCSDGADSANKPAQALRYAVAGCHDFTTDDRAYDMFDHLQRGDVHVVFSDVRDSVGPLQQAANLDTDWVPLARNARTVVATLRKADAAVAAGRDPVWTEDWTIGVAARTVRAECARAVTLAGGVTG